MAAELRAELPRIDRAVDELKLVRPLAATAVHADAQERVRLYAASALLDTFYTAVERVLQRLARAFDVMPTGPTWHMYIIQIAGL